MNALTVFYTPHMVAESLSMSPSASKPALVVEAWRRAGLPLLVLDPPPVTVDDLARVHDPAFVIDVLAGRRSNGFGNCSPQVAASLLYTSGSMLAAARYAVTHRTIASAPCSGFHHAGYDQSAGFCTFNGLVVAAFALYAQGRVSRVGILDCDMHYGDGTDELLERHRPSWIEHYTAGRDYHDPHQAIHFLKRLPELVERMRECDVVLYQAGADPHINDPLGGWLTTEQLMRRDEIVFDTLAECGIPVAWNLAGGYQVEPDGSIPKVLEIHTNTARAALGVRAKP